MVWIDYKKAYDMIPDSCILESLKLARVAENAVEFYFEVNEGLECRFDVL